MPLKVRNNIYIISKLCTSFKVAGSIYICKIQSIIEHPQGIGRSGGPPSGGAGGDRDLGKGPGKNPGPRRAGDGAPPSLAGRRNAGGGASDDALPPGADADAKGRGAAEGGGPRKVRPGRPRRAARPRRWGAITGPTGWPARPGHRPAPYSLARQHAAPM